MKRVPMKVMISKDKSAYSLLGSKFQIILKIIQNYNFSIRSALPFLPGFGVLNEIWLEAKIGFRYRPVHRLLDKGEVTAGTSTNL
jgi:hypothetical protein